MTRDPHACAVVPTQRKHHPAGVSLRGLCGGSGRGQHGGGMGGLGHNGMHGGGPLVTKSLLVVNSGGRYVEGMVEAARAITAYDKDTGPIWGRYRCPPFPTAIPSRICTKGSSASPWPSARRAGPAARS